MQPAQRFLSAIALTLLSASAFASTTVYTSPATFLTNVAAGSYFNDFNGLPNPPVGAVSFSGNGFGYTAFAPSDIYLEGGFLGASQINEDLKITFVLGTVTAFGANFFATDIQDDFQAVSVTLTLSDGTVETFTPTSIADSYRGFVSTSPITSIVFSGPGQSLYAGLDNFTVGAAVPVIEVPEPTSLALVGLGVAGILAARRRAA